MAFRFFGGSRRIACLLLLVMIAGCTSTVSTNISTFKRMPLVSAEKRSVFIAPGGTVDGSTLEFQFYRDKLALKLAQEGYRTPSAGPYDYRIELSYDVKRQKVRQPRNRLISTGFHTWGFRYGGSVYTQLPEPAYEFKRTITLDMIRNAVVGGQAKAYSKKSSEKGDKVLEVVATSVGGCEYLNIVFDEMLDAIFKNLDRPSGSLVNVRVSGDNHCRQ